MHRNKRGENTLNDLLNVNITDYLKPGLENAKKGQELAREINTSTRIIERLIARARTEGAPICANTYHGYYLAPNRTALYNYIDNLDKRAKKMLVITSAMRKIDMQDEDNKQLSLKDIN